MKLNHALKTTRNTSDKLLRNFIFFLFKQIFYCLPACLISTLTVAARSCDILPAGAIQIIHIRSNHWVCINVNEDKSSVCLYDSKCSTISSPVVDLILKIIQFKGDIATIKSMLMQEQKGDDSCGLFSLAVATALCNKQNPSTIHWNQAWMWQHLVHCFEEEKMILFPIANHLPNKKEAVKTIIIENLHCIWRRYKNKEKMKQYSKCCRWYMLTVCAFQLMF